MLELFFMWRFFVIILYKDDGIPIESYISAYKHMNTHTHKHTHIYIYIYI